MKDVFKKIINIDQICSIKTFINVENQFYTYSENKKFLGFTTMEEGFFNKYGLQRVLVTPEEILKDGYSFISGKKVFYKPFVRITTSDNNSHEIYFDTVDKLNEFINAEGLCERINWLKV